MNCFQRRLAGMSAAVYIAVILFSMSTWLDVVGVWIEMPLFVTTLPEGWSLPSYLAVIIQLANVGPAVYAIVRTIRRRGSRAAKKEDGRTGKSLDAEVVLVLVIIAVAALNVFVLSFLWQTTLFVGGYDRSIVMLTLVVPAALTSCLSSVVFLPYMARFPSSYISAYYVGQGFSGLVPGLIGLVQGAGSPPDCLWNSTQLVSDTVESLIGNVSGTSDELAAVIVENQEPLFSVQVFFCCLTALFFVSLGAFCFLNCSSRGRSAMLSQEPSKNYLCDQRQHLGDKPLICQNGDAASASAANHSNVDFENHDGHRMYEFHRDPSESTGRLNEHNGVLNSHQLVEKTEVDVTVENKCMDTSAEESSATASARMPKRVFIRLLLLIGLVSALSNGLLPSTQSYTCLPYGYLVYTLAVRLSAVAASLSSLSSMFLPRGSVKVVFGLSLLGLTIATFHLVLALQSPKPILRGHLLGDIIVIVSAVVMDASFSFVRVSVACLLHEGGGRHKLLWCGGVTQAGSFCGALVAFLLVSCFRVFKTGTLCPTD